MKNKYNLHEVIFSGDNEQDKLMREDARVQKILEDVAYRIEGELILEGWFDDMLAKVKGWFSNLFGFGGDDDESEDGQFTPTEKDLRGALSNAGVYGLLAGMYDTGEFNGADLKQQVADAMWPKVESILDRTYPKGTSEGSDADVRLRKDIGSLKALNSWVEQINGIKDKAMADAEFMNKGFGDLLVEAVNKVPIENFIPKPEPQKENRRYSLANALFEQGDDKEKSKTSQGTSKPEKKDAAKKNEPAKPTKEQLAGAKKMRDAMIAKTKKTSTDVFQNKAMAEFQCEALIAEISMSVAQPLREKVDAVRSSKEDHWAGSANKKSNRVQIDTAIKGAVRERLKANGVNTNDSMKKIGMMIYDAYQTKDPVKYYMGMLSAYKASK